MSAPLDLEAIRERSTRSRMSRDKGRLYDTAADVPALIAEIERLRSVVMDIVIERREEATP